MNLYPPEVTLVLGVYFLYSCTIIAAYYLVDLALECGERLVRVFFWSPSTLSISIFVACFRRPIPTWD